MTPEQLSHLRRWIAENTVADPVGHCNQHYLYRAYARWCADNLYTPVTISMFRDHFATIAAVRETRQGVFYFGVIMPVYDFA